MLMRKMDIHALYQKPGFLSHIRGTKYIPICCGGWKLPEPNHVWVTDICYLADGEGVLLSCGHYGLGEPSVLAWRLSNTLDPSFCTDALEEALQRYGTPEIFNTDQGSQFTSEAFTAFWPPVVSGSAWTARTLGGQCVYRKAVEERQIEEVYLKAYRSIVEPETS